MMVGMEHSTVGAGADSTVVDAGGNEPVATSVAAVLGRQPDITPLLVRRGLLTADA